MSMWKEYAGVAGYANTGAPMNRLKGKIALVTGGTSGIGLATAKLFTEEGARVFVTGRRQAELDAAVLEIGGETVGIRGDVSHLADLDDIFARIKDVAGALDVVFTNAGGGSLAPLGEITEEQYDTTFDTNVKGTLFTVQKALPLLREGASVILNSSTTGTRGTPSFSVYSASKAAVRNFARSWVLDLRGRGIRVNVLSPGATRTAGLTTLVSPDKADAWYAQRATAIPLGRVGEAREIAMAALFLASDESSFVNGVELFADGGSAQV
jgi:NAD(P)-dependent dehydrogenase (short-subunit alcohol dehydrogenase family)